MMRLASFGKLKNIQTSRSFDPTFDEPRSPRAKLEKTSSAEVRSPRGPNFISRLANLGSSKSKRSTTSTPRTMASPFPRAVLHSTDGAELEMAFEVFDANGDGQICITELGAVLRSLGGGELSEEELQLIMREVDTDQNSSISLNEFMDAHNRKEGQDPIREAFATFDKDGNNLISADELRAVLQSLGEKDHTLEDCRRMIDGVDLDGDGLVNYNEFENLLSAKS